MRESNGAGFLAAVLALVLGSCSAPRTAIELVGSWHAGPSVGSGFQERYVFRSDGTFTWYADEGAEASRKAVAGSWTLAGSEIDLGFHRALGPEGPAQAEETQHLTWGPLEKEDPSRSPYPVVTTLGGERFWQVSTDTSVWADPFTTNSDVTEASAMAAVLKVVGPLPPKETLLPDAPVDKDGTNYFVIHHAEELDDGQGTSHTATKNWYYVEHNSGKVYRVNETDESLEEVSPESQP